MSDATKRTGKHEKEKDKRREINTVHTWLKIQDGSYKMDARKE